MTTRAPARRRRLEPPDLDRRIEDAESRAVIVWRGEQLRFRAVPERITRISDRRGRDHLYAAYQDAFEALNPLYEERLAAWRGRGNLVKLAAKDGTDPATLAVTLERFSLHVETPYYAALRRYLALIDIEQGDATEADLWHVVRGSAWAQWFGDRELRRALTAVGRACRRGHRPGRLAQRRVAACRPAAGGSAHRSRWRRVRDAGRLARVAGRRARRER